MTETPPCGATMPTTPGHSGLAHHHTHTCARPTVNHPHPGTHRCGGCGAQWTTDPTMTVDVRTTALFSVPTTDEPPLATATCQACGTEMPTSATFPFPIDGDDTVMGRLCNDNEACMARVRGRQAQGGGADPGHTQTDGPAPGRPFLSRAEKPVPARLDAGEPVSPDEMKALEGRWCGETAAHDTHAWAYGGTPWNAGPSPWYRCAGSAARRWPQDHADDVSVVSTGPSTPVDGPENVCGTPNPAAPGLMTCHRPAGDDHGPWHADRSGSVSWALAGETWTAATRAFRLIGRLRSRADDLDRVGRERRKEHLRIMRHDLAELTDLVGRLDAERQAAARGETFPAGGGYGQTVPGGWMAAVVTVDGVTYRLAPEDVAFLYPDRPADETGPRWFDLGATTDGHTATAELVQTFDTETAERLDAGHNLAAAMYYAPKADPWWTSAGQGVMEAYSHACKVFHIGDGRVSGPRIAGNPGRCLKQVQCGRTYGHDGGCEE